MYWRNASYHKNFAILKQVDSIQTEVVSIHIKSRFGTVEVNLMQTTARIEKNSD